MANNALAVLDNMQSQLPALPDEAFDSLVGEQNVFATRLQLFSFNSGPVKDGDIKAGQFGIVNGNEVQAIGDEIIILPIGVRSKAMDLNGDRPVIAYDLTGQLFKSIQARSKEPNSNCMCGVEYLVYLPNEDTFTTFYLANATLLREAGNIKKNLGYALSVKSKLIKKEKYSWHGIQVAMCPADVKIPDRERMLAELENFKNAVDSSPEGQ